MAPLGGGTSGHAVWYILADLELLLETREK